MTWQFNIFFLFLSVLETFKFAKYTIESRDDSHIQPIDIGNAKRVIQCIIVG